MKNCIYCKKEIKPLGLAPHQRLCPFNPDVKKESHPSYGRKGVNQYTKGEKMREEVKDKISKSLTGRKHKEETKKILSEKGLNSNHRRLNRKIIEYKGIKLDSKWEFEVAKSLDENGIEWTRPDPLLWEDEKGKFHHYFPDFYIPSLDLYLDPKNPEAFRVQKNKIEIISKKYSNIVFIKTLEECKNFGFIVKGI